MNIHNRLLRITYSESHNVLITSDVKGRVYKFDLELNLLQTSPTVSYTRPINSLCVTDQYIFTKDRAGAIGKWSLDTLEPLDFYDENNLCIAEDLMEDEEPSPSPNRGIAVFNNRLYTTNGYNQMVVLDVESFDVVDIRLSPSPTFFDCLCVTDATTHALSDVEGRLFIGNIESYEFPVEVRVDSNVVHGVVYDKRHDRFWTTQDGGFGDDMFVKTGVTTIEKDGTGFKSYPISHEDNEFIQFDPKCRYLFVGGFNGKICVFDNTEKDFSLKKVIGPLDFQIIHACVVSHESIYALLQTGEIVNINADGKIVNQSHYRNKCAWIFEPHPGDDSHLYVGTDDGVTLLRYKPGKFNTIQIEQLAKHTHGFGIIKDVKVLPDGSYLGISRSGYVFKANYQGDLLWYRQVLGVPRSIAVNIEYDRCMVSSDAGTVYELLTANGELHDEIPVGSASYGCTYTVDGRRAVTADRHQAVHVYAADSHDILGSVKFSLRLKRLFRDANNHILVTGADGVFELDLDNYKRKHMFGECMTNTKENAVICGNYVYAGGYGYQLGVYEYATDEIVGLAEYLPDFTKAFATRICEDGRAILLVGGRSGFINAYNLIDGMPHKVREFYLR